MQGDSCVAVTAMKKSHAFRMSYVFAVIEPGTRRLAHINGTANPTADWTAKRLREVVWNGGHRYLIHDRDQIFAKQLDDSIRATGRRSIAITFVLPVPKANAICERVVRTARHECLDWLIPMSRRICGRFSSVGWTHYNCGRPHGCWDGVPDPPEKHEGHPKADTATAAADTLVLVKSIPGGLHHEHSLAATPTGP